MTIRIRNTSPHPLPRKATEGASGFDIQAHLPGPLTLAPLQRTLVPTGLYLEIPMGHEAQVRPRSGLALRHGLTVANAPGTIDADYRGELNVLLINLGQEPVTLNPGDRIAQLVFAAVAPVTLAETDALADTERGAGGFGHTGV